MSSVEDIQPSRGNVVEMQIPTALVCHAQSNPASQYSIVEKCPKPYNLLASSCSQDLQLKIHFQYAPSLPVKAYPLNQNVFAVRLQLHT